jgi:hypothetical protein
VTPPVVAAVDWSCGQFTETDIKQEDDPNYVADCTPHCKIGESDSFDISGDGNTMVGGVMYDNTKASQAGRVTVFKRSSSGTWSKDTDLYDPTANAEDMFGRWTRISGDGNTIISYTWDAYGESQTSAGKLPGYVNVFVRDASLASGWKHQAKLEQSSDGLDLSDVIRVDQSYSRSAISKDGNTVMTCSGSLRVAKCTPFTRSGNTWTEGTDVPINYEKVDPRGHQPRPLSLIMNGHRLSGDGNLFAFGIHHHRFAGLQEVRVYKRTGGTWALQSTIDAPADVQDGDGFGFSVAMSGGGTTIIVGAPFQGSDDRGAAYAFQWDDTTSTWVEDGKLITGDSGRQFIGHPVVAVSDDGTLAFATEQMKDTHRGSVYMWKRNVSGEGTATWTQVARLAETGAPQHSYNFQGLAMSADASIIIGNSPESNGSNGKIMTFSPACSN